MPKVAPQIEVPKRVRLSPAQRKQLILEAALVEFGAHGFDGASTTKIAQRAELSQAGLYAHFKSKEDILLSLLTEMLLPAPTEYETASALQHKSVADFIEESYATLCDEKKLAVVRVLIAESARIPRLIAQWRERGMLPYLEYRQQQVDALIASGKLQKNAVTQNAKILMAPLINVLLVRLIMGDSAEAQAECQELRQAHEAMVHAFAIPQPDVLQPNT